MPSDGVRGGGLKVTEPFGNWRLCIRPRAEPSSSPGATSRQRRFGNAGEEAPGKGFGGRTRGGHGAGSPRLAGRRQGLRARGSRLGAVTRARGVEAGFAPSPRAKLSFPPAGSPEPPTPNRRPGPEAPGARPACRRPLCPPELLLPSPGTPGRRWVGRWLWEAGSAEPGSGGRGGVQAGARAGAGGRRGGGARRAQRGPRERARLREPWFLPSDLYSRDAFAAVPVPAAPGESHLRVCGDSGRP